MMMITSTVALTNVVSILELKLCLVKKIKHLLASDETITTNQYKPKGNKPVRN